MWRERSFCDNRVYLRARRGPPAAPGHRGHPIVPVFPEQSRPPVPLLHTVPLSYCSADKLSTQISLHMNFPLSPLQAPPCVFAPTNLFGFCIPPPTHTHIHTLSSYHTRLVVLCMPKEKDETAINSQDKCYISLYMVQN